MTSTIQKQRGRSEAIGGAAKSLTACHSRQGAVRRCQLDVPVADTVLMGRRADPRNKTLMHERS